MLEFRIKVHYIKPYGLINYRSALVQVMAWHNNGQQGNTWNNADHDTWCHMASPGNNELNSDMWNSLCPLNNLPTFSSTRSMYLLIMSLVYSTFDFTIFHHISLQHAGGGCTFPVQTTQYSVQTWSTTCLLMPWLLHHKAISNHDVSVQNYMKCIYIPLFPKMKNRM